MLILILSLISLGLILFVATYFQRRNKVDEVEVIIEPAGECCGAHEVCEQDTLLSADSKIVYFDDEELDDLANISPTNYSNIQLKQLTDVFLTLKESDVAGWLRSIQMRQIQLPNDLREQALLIVSERRNN